MKKYLVTLMKNDDVDVELFDTLEAANDYATNYYNHLSEYDKKRYTVEVGYVEKSEKYYPQSELDEADEDFDWYSFHSYDYPDGAAKF